jgi:hypothetical protein
MKLGEVLNYFTNSLEVATILIGRLGLKEEAAYAETASDSGQLVRVVIACDRALVVVSFSGEANQTIVAAAIPWSAVHLDTVELSVTPSRWGDENAEARLVFSQPKLELAAAKDSPDLASLAALGAASLGHLSGGRR